MPRKYTMRSKEEKLSIVKQVLNGISVCNWERQDLRVTIEQTVYYFNNERPVRKLKGKPPVLFRTELVA